MTKLLHFGAAAAVCLVLAASGGCTAFLEPREPYPITPPEASPFSAVPRELDMVSLPPYVIEPPDILMINAVKIVPKPPHHLEPFDGILVRVVDASGLQIIGDAYVIDPEGMIDLGPEYGRVNVVGMTVVEALDAIRRHLAATLEDPEVSVSLAFSAGAQQIVGEHLVGPDGRVNLGTYGSVYVAGMTIDEARETIERQLSNFLLDPQVVVDIFAYNSKKYYVVTQGAGFGDDIRRFPVTGNETVLDAISQVQGLSRLSSKNIWIARPSPTGCDQILPVRWDEITQGGGVCTNYQVLPGDRIYIGQDHFIAFDSLVNKLLNPFERMFGTTLLGVQTMQNIRALPNSQQFN
jgi:polysaccharide export outer membrane protein